MPDSKTLIVESIQYQHDLIKIPYEPLCLVSVECELLKDDFCERFLIPKFLELGDDIPFNVMFPFR